MKIWMSNLLGKFLKNLQNNLKKWKCNKKWYALKIYISDQILNLQMGDAIDSGIDTANDEEEADKVYTQICDEIGVDISEE